MSNNDPWYWSKQNQQPVAMQPQISNVVAPLANSSQEQPSAPGAPKADPLEGMLMTGAATKAAGAGADIAKSAYTKGMAEYAAASAAPLAATATEAAATGLMGSALPAAAGGATAATAGGLGASLAAGGTAAAGALGAGMAAAAPVVLPALGMYAAYKAVKGGK